MRLLSRFTKATLALSLFGCARTSPPAAVAVEASPAPTPAPQSVDSGVAAAEAVPSPVLADAAAPATSLAPTPGKAVNDFALNTFKVLRTEKGNLFFSGESLRGALGMTALGAQGTTLSEMARTLGVDADPAKNAAAAHASRDAWKAAAGSAELAIANRLWVEKKTTFEKTFLENAQSGYGATSTPLDFVKAAEASRTTINGWVSDQTKGKIKDLLPKGSVSADTRLVLTNAIYFKGNWADAFDAKATKSEPFHADGGDVTIATMHRSAEMQFAETPDGKVVQLPYKGSDLAMLVVLPSKREGLDALEQGLTSAQIDGWTQALHAWKIDLSLPKFTFSWGHSVKPALEALGIHEAFGNGADFSGFTGGRASGLALSDVFHKAFILVDETGTEAAAATGGVVMLRSLPRKHEMKVDRPFLFFIRNTKSGEILFAGRFAAPKA